MSPRSPLPPRSGARLLSVRLIAGLACSHTTARTPLPRTLEELWILALPKGRRHGWTCLAMGACSKRCGFHQHASRRSVWIAFSRGNYVASLTSRRHTIIKSCLSPPLLPLLRRVVCCPWPSFHIIFNAGFDRKASAFTLAYLHHGVPPRRCCSSTDPVFLDPIERFQDRALQVPKTTKCTGSSSQLSPPSVFPAHWLQGTAGASICACCW